MVKKFKLKKTTLLIIAASALSTLVYAKPELAPLPSNWKAHPPIHLKSKNATLAPAGMSPAQIKKAYGIPSTSQGAGQVIAIIDAYDDPNIESDLGVFSSTFGLPACTTANGCFTKVYQNGTRPTADSGWAMEMSLDVEWAHAIAPQAKIILIEAANSSGSLYQAINLAVANKATVISLSWGGSEFSGETTYDTAYFKNLTVPVFVSSGDSGAGVSYPAASPYVISTGGTQLTLDSNGNYSSETAWSGSGGGISAYETEPSYQTGYPIPQNGKGRGVPDVAYNASPSTGYSIYDSYGQGGWLVVGGTSASAPQWAALTAIANSARTTNLSGLNTVLYNAAKTSSSTLFNDITRGTNGNCGYLCTAQTGFDYITGFGTPKVSNLLSYLEGTCIRANPTISFSPTSQSGTAGSTLNYTLDVVNHDNQACGSSNFNLTSMAPSGLAATISPTLLTLSPGSTGKATLMASSMASAPAATYTLSGTATDAAATTYTATATANYVLNSPSATEYAYVVYIGYPFNPVTVNNSITCPQNGNPACLVSNQASGSTMIITGKSTDKCSLLINADGSLTIQSGPSTNCGADFTSASRTKAGEIRLPSGF
jgi:subtilase family serine protease